MSQDGSGSNLYRVRNTGNAHPGYAPFVSGGIISETRADRDDVHVRPAMQINYKNY